MIKRLIMGNIKSVKRPNNIFIKMFSNSFISFSPFSIFNIFG